MPTAAPTVPAAPAADTVQPFRWTRAQYDRLVETGVLGADDKVELIEGQIVYKMPQNSPHEVTTGLVSDALRAAFGTGFHTRDEKSIALSEQSKPEPDVAVVEGRRRDYADGAPSVANVLLVVVVAESSLLQDRTRKARLYASAGVPEYWIVNLPGRVVEVHRDPADGTYRTKTTHAEGETVAPAARPDAALSVADLLP